MNIVEGFRWFREEFKPLDRNGKNLFIKGKAIVPTISRNKRRYLEKELQASARTLTGKPMDVNHAVDVWEDQKQYHEDTYGKGSFEVKKPKHVGNVLYGEYEDGAVEYVAQINDPEYREKLIDRRDMTLEQYRAKHGKDPVYGVSISASFRYPEEGKDILTPIGIVFERLSLVEDPERPGVVGTTIRVMETEGEKQRGEAEIVDMLLEYKYTVDDSLREMNTMSEKELDFASVDTLNPQNKHLRDSLLREMDEETEETGHYDKDDEEEEDSSEETVEAEQMDEEPEKDEEDSSDVEESIDTDETVEEKCPDEDKEDETEETVDETPLSDVTLETVTDILEEEPDTSLEEERRLFEIRVEKQRQDGINKRVSENLKIVSGNMSKLHDLVKQNTGINGDKVSEVADKMRETRGTLKDIQSRLEEKAGVDKVVKLKETVEQHVSELEKVKDAVKEGDAITLQLVETVTGFTNLMDSYNSVVDEYKTQLDSSEQKVTELESKITELEKKDYTSLLEAQLKEAEDKITLLETKDYTSELEQKLENQKLEYEAKLKEIAEKDYTSAIEAQITELFEKFKRVDSLEEKMESITHDIGGNFKSTETDEPIPDEKTGYEHLENPEYQNI